MSSHSHPDLTTQSLAKDGHRFPVCTIPKRDGQIRRGNDYRRKYFGAFFSDLAVLKRRFENLLILLLVLCLYVLAALICFDIPQSRELTMVGLAIP